MLGAVILAAFNTPLVGEIMLGAALLTVLTGILTMDQAYGAMNGAASSWWQGCCPWAWR